MDFIGEICPVCNEAFTADDDIVVCPDCGTPHHRACYKINNYCSNIAIHGTGEKWKRSKHEEKLYKICPVCRFPNRAVDEKCQRCGSDLAEATSDPFEKSEENGDQPRDPFGSYSRDDLFDPLKYMGFDPDEDMGGATLKDVSDFVGPSTIYYVPKFKQMKESGVRPSFNLFSLIFPSLFFANRKMWGWAIIAAILGIIFNLPANLLMVSEEYPQEIAGFIADNQHLLKTMSEVFMIADMGIRALTCLFANWLYFRFAMRSLKKLKKNGAESTRIKSVGGVKPMNMVLIILIKYGIGIVLVMLLYMLISMLITINDFSTLCLW
ncbi:MAG: DUF2628 domain-containing protein [Ruminococcus sp.]|nr:DUF2628 domain-containing protein [Ruminococcus sp.]